MLNLPEKILKYLDRGWIKPAALVGIVTSVMSDEKTTAADWDAGSIEGQAGTDWPATSLASSLAAAGTSAAVSSTAGFTVGSAYNPGFLVLTDGTNVEIASYTGSTLTSFTGLTRGLYGTAARDWPSGDDVWQLVHSHGVAPDYNLGIQPQNWTQPSPSGGPPCARLGHKMVYAAAEDKYYMFGGWNGSSYLNDLWQYDPASDSWSQLSPAGGAPGGRFRHCMAYVSGQLWIYGGWDGSAYLNDVWKYSIAGNSWSTSASWNGPGAKHSAMECPYGQGMLVTGGLTSVLGGYPNGCPFTYYFDGNAWYSKSSALYNWSKGAACWMDHEGMMMVAAREQTGIFLAAAYDPVTNSWHHADVADPPVSLYFPSLVYDDANHRALLFAGAPVNSYGTRILYSYERNANQWTRLDDFSREDRTCHAALWDSSRREMFVWGGSTNSLGPNWPSYADPLKFRYYRPSAKYLTSTIDLGETPAEGGVWLMEDVRDSVNNPDGIVYTADYSDDGSSWEDMGVIKDGQEISEKHRYYRVHATLSAAGLNTTPMIQLIDALFDNIEYFSMASRPVADYPPVVANVSSLTSQIDLVKCSANVGSIDIELLNTGNIASKLITDYYPRDNTVKLKIGVLEDGFEASDFALVLKGRIGDWSCDGNSVKFSITDFLGELKKEIPQEDSSTGQITPLDYSTGGIASNPVDILLDILQNRLDIADRDIDMDSFLTVKADPSLSGWNFQRVVGSPEDAYKMCGEICRHIGAVMIPREDGKISIRILDPAAEPAAVWNERDKGFSAASFKGEGDSFRNFVSTWWHWDGSGDEYSDFEGIEVAADADSIENWGLKVLRTKSKWLGDDASPYYGDALAAAISQRILNLSKNGVPVVSLETNMSAFPAQVGDLIRVRSSVVESLDEYKAWQTARDPEKKLDFKNETGRYSIPYIVFGCSECIDMKFWVTRKRVDFVKGTIKWELSRARQAPLQREFSSQDDFHKGTGAKIDFESNPGSVQLAIESGGLYYESGTYELVVDMDQQPEQAGKWTLTTTEPAGTAVSFEAYASETGHFLGEQIPLGQVEDDDDITVKTRWYKIVATLEANEAKDSTPTIDLIKAVFENG